VNPSGLVEELGATIKPDHAEAAKAEIVFLAFVGPI